MPQYLLLINTTTNVVLQHVHDWPEGCWRWGRRLICWVWSWWNYHRLWCWRTQVASQVASCSSTWSCWFSRVLRMDGSTPSSQAPQRKGECTFPFDQCSHSLTFPHEIPMSESNCILLVVLQWTECSAHKRLERQHRTRVRRQAKRYAQQRSRPRWRFPTSTVFHLAQQHSKGKLLLLWYKE